MTSTGEGVAEGLRLTDASRRISKDAIVEPVDLLERRAVSRRPIGIVLPSVGREDKPYHDKGCCSRSPLRAWANALDQVPGVRGGPEQVRGLFQRRIVLLRDQYGVAAS